MINPMPFNHWSALSLLLTYGAMSAEEIARFSKPKKLPIGRAVETANSLIALGCVSVTETGHYLVTEKGREVVKGLITECENGADPNSFIGDAKAAEAISAAIRMARNSPLRLIRVKEVA